MSIAFVCVGSLCHTEKPGGQLALAPRPRLGVVFGTLTSGHHHVPWGGPARRWHSPFRFPSIRENSVTVTCFLWLQEQVTKSSCGKVTNWGFNSLFVRKRVRTDLRGQLVSDALLNIVPGCLFHLNVTNQSGVAPVSLRQKMDSV